MIPDKLFVKRWLWLSGGIAFQRPEARRVRRQYFINQDYFVFIFAPLKFRITNYNSFCQCVFTCFFVYLYAFLSQFFSKFFAGNLYDSNEMFSSCPDVAFVEGVKIGFGSLSLSFKLSGKLILQMVLFSLYSFHPEPAR